MNRLIERLRAALAPQYEIDRELASGGMGIVFLGKDTALDRPVAIKVLRPELATAEAAERFLREARVLASLSHRAIIPIHDLGNADGIPYFIMEYLERGTLEERLRSGPLPRADVKQLGMDLLDGLVLVHARGVVHRDIKPSNIFLRHGRPLLGDFGIAKDTTAAATALTEPGRLIGSPAYMPPEQFVGGDVTPAADVYTVGMVLYEAATGRRWEGAGDTRQADWTGIDRHMVRVLTRALELSPADRYPDATSFSKALGGLPLRRRALPIAAAAGAATLVVGLVLRPTAQPPDPRITDLAILPLTAGSGASAELGRDLAGAVAFQLEGGFTGRGMTITPMALVAPWREASGSFDDSLNNAAWRELGTRHVARGTVTRTGDSLEIRLAVIDTAGIARTTGRIRGRFEDRHDLAFSIGLELVSVVAPDLVTRYKGVASLRGKSTEAIDALIAGDWAFQRETWPAAQAAYERALALDSTLVLAWWRLFNARRWRRDPMPREQLAAVFRQHAGDFSGLDSLLIEADIAGSFDVRLANLQEAVRRYPADAYPWLLYGNELFHRGALVGIGLDSAITILDSSVARNPFLAPAHSTLAWALIRQGARQRSAEVLARYGQIAAPITEVDLCLECFLQLAWAERFDATQAARMRAETLGGQGGVEGLSRALRMGPSCGIPHAQFEVAAALARTTDPVMRREAMLAQGLAAIGLGRIGEALALFDMVATAGDPDLRLQAAQWRLLPGVVGMPGVAEPDRVTGRQILEVLASSPVVGARAAWTLAADAYGRRDDAAAARWRERASVDSGSPLGTLLKALAAEAVGDVRTAIRETDRVVAFDVGGRGGEPFVRALTHLKRGQWKAAAGDAYADAEWRWYENADFERWLQGPAQPAEIDWAFETFGRYLRGVDASRRGDRATACRVLPDAVARWESADAEFDPLLREMRDALRRCRARDGSP
ncbi:MAG TPA: serine/threonine-protein kinase [Gemmatimonadales bacterium]